MNVTDLYIEMGEASAILASFHKDTLFEVDRTKHDPCLRIFTDKRQIGFIARSKHLQCLWRASRMHQGTPVSEFRGNSLRDCLEHITAPYK